MCLGYSPQDSLLFTHILLTFGPLGCFLGEDCGAGNQPGHQAGITPSSDEVSLLLSRCFSGAGRQGIQRKGNKSWLWGHGRDKGTWGRSRLSLHKSHPAGTPLTPPGLQSGASRVAKGRESDLSPTAGRRKVVGGKLAAVPWEPQLSPTRSISHTFVHLWSGWFSEGGSLRKESGAGTGTSSLNLCLVPVGWFSVFLSLSLSLPF